MQFLDVEPHTLMAVDMYFFANFFYLRIATNCEANSNCNSWSGNTVPEPVINQQFTWV